MLRVWNLSPFSLIGQFGGVSYLLPPGQKIAPKRIKTYHPEHGYDEVIDSEEIANKLFADLQNRGVVLFNDEEPLSDEEYRAQSRGAQMQYIEDMIADFNQQNLELAAQGKKVMRVPKHYKELRDHLLKLKAEDNGDSDPGEGFLSREELDAEAAKARVLNQPTKEAMIAAAETGSAEAVMQAGEQARIAETGKIPLMDRESQKEDVPAFVESPRRRRA